VLCLICTKRKEFLAFSKVRKKLNSGNGINVVRITPFSAISFYAYEFYKFKLFSPEKQNTGFTRLVCGGLTGITASTMTYPLDLVRTVLSVNTESKLGMVECGKNIYKQGGVLGLYKGWVPTMIGITPYIGINMATFDYLKTNYQPPRTSKSFDAMTLLLGAIAGYVVLTLELWQ
jgi:solute carrier family 25 phosphate transporter 23/24/25/41